MAHQLRYTLVQQLLKDGDLIQMLPRVLETTDTNATHLVDIKPRDDNRIPVATLLLENGNSFNQQKNNLQAIPGG